MALHDPNHLKHLILPAALALQIFSCRVLLAQEQRQTEFLSFISQNDLYQPALKSDKDFTNGLLLEYGAPILQRLGGGWIGFELENSEQEYSLALVQEMFTPENVLISAVDSTDRPYSGLLYLQLKANSNRLPAGRRLSSRLSIGLQGPGALAKETQSGIHGLIDNDIPQGWDNQIGHGLLLDYELRYQHLITPTLTYMESSLEGTGHIGTMRNFIRLGVLNRIGWFNSSFQNFGGLRNPKQPVDQKIRVEKSGGGSRRVYVNRRWQAYLVADAYLSYVLYDGTAAGSLIPFEESVYLLDGGQIINFSGATRLGIELSYGMIQIHYLWQVTGYRVSGSDLAGWGQFRLVVSFQ